MWLSLPGPASVLYFPKHFQQLPLSVPDCTDCKGSADRLMPISFRFCCRISAQFRNSDNPSFDEPEILGHRDQGNRPVCDCRRGAPDRGSGTLRTEGFPSRSIEQILLFFHLHIQNMGLVGFLARSLMSVTAAHSTVPPSCPGLSDSCDF